MGEALQARHYSPRTADAYRAWAKRFVYFHGLRHPAEMGELEITPSSRTWPLTRR